MKYGLIGEKLGHSYSCQVHRALGNPDYVLTEIAPDALGDFLRARDFAGLTVTIPYKQAVIPYVDALKAVALPAVEVHISDVKEREPFRQISYAGMACEKTIMGKGLAGYEEALEYLANRLANA